MAAVTRRAGPRRRQLRCSGVHFAHPKPARCFTFRAGPRRATPAQSRRQAIVSKLPPDSNTGGRPPRLLLLYGCVEAAIGVYALAFPKLFALAQELSLAVPQGAPGRAFAFDVGLAALLIGPPTLLMRATIPVLSQRPGVPKGRAGER